MDVSYFILLFLLSVSTCMAAAPIVPGKLSRSYRKGPIELTDNAKFYFQAEPSYDRTFFALVINDTSIVSSSENWLGIGIGEPSSGSMLGADIVTAHFRTHVHDSCNITDRYVPYVASPLGQPPRVFPLPDECKDSDWKLISCSRDVVQGIMVLEVRRPNSILDSRQDRPILPGLSSILHSYGGPFGYHGAKRHSTKIKLFSLHREESPYSLNGLPNDVSNHIEVRASTFEIPSTHKIRACTSARIPLLDDEKVMIVAVEPIINDESTSLVQQIVLLLCSGEAYANSIAETKSCEDDSTYGPLGNEDAKCSSFIYSYTRGTKGFLFPSNVGVLVTPEKPFLVMETHYSNPEDGNGGYQFDTSGVRVHYTSKPRKFAVGTLFLGDPLVSREGDTVMDGVQYQHTCPKSCTSRFQRAINVFNSFSYMRATGKSIYTNMFRSNGRFIQNVNKVNFWSEGFQMTRQFEPVLKLRNGDQLQTTCIYNVSKTPGLKFGLGRNDEICLEILSYWPVQTDKVTGGSMELCAFMRGRSSIEGFTICGDSHQMATVPLNSANPEFNDTVGAFSVFGLLSEQCPAPSLTPEPTSSNVAEASSPEPSIKGSMEPELSSYASSEVPDAAVTVPGGADEEENEGVGSSASSRNECFSASSTVQLRSGEVITMEELKVGDFVHVGNGKYSKVFMFTHADRDAHSTFVSLVFEQTGSELMLTPGHYIPVIIGGVHRTKRAGDISVGHSVLDAYGKLIPVSKVLFQRGYGLYNPQTLDGSIVVNGIIATTFTEAVEPVTATALLTPLRYLFSKYGVDFSQIFI